MNDGVTVTTGSAAIIRVSDPALRKAIFDKVASNANRLPKVAFREEQQEIVLVFNDRGEIKIGVQGHEKELAQVAQSEGKFLVYAEPPPSPIADSGNPNIPPPDTLCPCGGP